MSLDEGRSLSQEARNYGAIQSYKAQDETCADDNNDFDDCVICFDNPIDSVAVSVDTRFGNVFLLQSVATASLFINVFTEPLRSSSYVYALCGKRFTLPCLCIGMYFYQSLQIIKGLHSAASGFIDGKNWLSAACSFISHNYSYCIILQVQVFVQTFAVLKCNLGLRMMLWMGCVEPFSRGCP